MQTAQAVERVQLLERQSRGNPLTCLANRCRLDAKLEAQFLKAAALLIDVEHFRWINNGHLDAAGDRAIGRVADRRQP